MKLEDVNKVKILLARIITHLDEVESCNQLILCKQDEIEDSKKTIANICVQLKEFGIEIES